MGFSISQLAASITVVSGNAPIPFQLLVGAARPPGVRVEAAGRGVAANGSGWKVGRVEPRLGLTERRGISRGGRGSVAGLDWTEAGTSSSPAPGAAFTPQTSSRTW